MTLHSHQPPQDGKRLTVVVRVFLPFAFGYWISYLFRTVNAVIAPDLVADLGLGGADLGLVTSAYFLTFAAFQIPLGVLLDRFGSRRVEASLLLFAAVGAVVYGAAEGTAGLVVGRALIGLGVSACLMAAFRAYVYWFPPDRLPFINGLQMAAGGLGALSATAPVEILLGVIDWRGLFFGLGLLSLVIAALVFVVVPRRGEGGDGQTLARQLRGVGEIFTSPVFWRIAPITVFSQAAFLAIQSLWTGPWLKDVAGLDRAGVASHLLIIAAAMVAGFVVIGWLTTRAERIGLKPITVALLSMGVFLGVQAMMVVGWIPSVLLLAVAFGFFGSAGVVPYAILSGRFPRNLAGRVNTGLNMMVFTFAFAGQWAIGGIIDLWPKTPMGGYAPEGYQAAFAVTTLLQVVAFVWYGLYRRD